MKELTGPTIYQYQHPHQFLKDRWTLKKQKRPELSLRSWSQALGLKSHGLLHQILQGHKSIPKKYLPKLIKSLELSTKEGLYLETLVDLSRAKSFDEQEIYHNRLKELAPKTSQISFTEMEAFKYLRDPLHLLLVEMMNLKGIEADEAILKKKILFKTDLAEIKEAKKRLLELGILESASNGKLRPSKHNMTNLVDVQSAGVQEYHRRVSLLAAEMVGKQTVNEREFNGHVLNIKRSSIKKAKKMMRDFITEFAREIEAEDSKDAEESYQLNLQFFRLTNHMETEDL